MIEIISLEETKEDSPSFCCRKYVDLFKIDSSIYQQFESSF